MVVHRKFCEGFDLISTREEGSVARKVIERDPAPLGAPQPRCRIHGGESRLQ